MTLFQRAFECHDICLGEFATGLTSIEDVAEYLCDPDNDSLELEALRFLIREWAEGRIAFWLCNWRNMGNELMTYDIPVDWRVLMATRTYAELAQQVFSACAWRLLK